MFALIYSIASCLEVRDVNCKNYAAKKIVYWGISTNPQGQICRVILESIVVGTNNSELAPGLFIPGGRCIDLRDIIEIHH